MLELWADFVLHLLVYFTELWLYITIIRNKVTILWIKLELVSFFQYKIVRYELAISDLWDKLPISFFFFFTLPETSEASAGLQLAVQIWLITETRLAWDEWYRWL